MPRMPLAISSATLVALAERPSSIIRELPEEIAEPPPRPAGRRDAVAGGGVRAGENGGAA